MIWWQQVLVVVATVAVVLPLMLFGGRWSRERRRAVDLQILWPACCEKAPDLDHAKAAFALHVFGDRAWTLDFDHDELVAFIDQLERPG
jgi:hypothetical protein